MKVRLYDHPVCDFCSEPPAWRYPADTFDMAAPGEPVRRISEQDWLACDLCAALIQRNEWTRLARRGLLTPFGKQAAEMIGLDAALAQISGLHKQFRAHRRGKVRYEPQQAR